MRTIIALGTTLWVAALTTSCGSDPVGPQEITQLPRDLEVAEVELIAADNAFGLKLFRQIQAETADGNIFVSPLSVAMALGMTYNGAAGSTLSAMQETLELQGLTLEQVNRSYRSLIDLLAGLDPSVEFILANSIWYRQGFPVEQSFLDVNREYFDAEVAALDFASPGAATTINDWVAEKTNGRIDEIVDSPIDPILVMFLINAIYFKGDWTYQFDRDLTRDAPFFLESGSEKLVPTMAYGEPVEVGYYKDSEIEAVDLPYGGKAYSMTIMLPVGEGNVGALVESLDGARWAQVVGGMAVLEAEVRMPKFTLEYELELNDALKALGMEVAFDQGAADFSKIYPGPERLFISKVKHKTFVDVNEEGTEAAAVTSVEVGLTSAPPVISVDRPFVFVIRERLSSTILFMGLITDPAGAA
ncbi:MAG: serpin family protein [Gemmatimonadota bacterium]|nr:MAG: serpin family protein [Gemmatimonadota bacterium]